MTLALQFLGVGSSQAVELGSSGAVLERHGESLLLVDCGPETLTRYLDRYGRVPTAIYVTHTHMDHVGGFERLFTRVWFDPALRGRVRVFAHAALVPLLQAASPLPRLCKSALQRLLPRECSSRPLATSSRNSTETISTTARSCSPSFLMAFTRA